MIAPLRGPRSSNLFKTSFNNVMRTPSTFEYVGTWPATFSLVGSWHWKFPTMGTFPSEFPRMGSWRGMFFKASFVRSTVELFLDFFDFGLIRFGSVWTDGDDWSIGVDSSEEGERKKNKKYFIIKVGSTIGKLKIRGIKISYLLFNMKIDRTWIWDNGICSENNS